MHTYIFATISKYYYRCAEPKPYYYYYELEEATVSSTFVFKINSGIYLKVFRHPGT